MKVLQTKFQNNSNLGLYGIATDKYCLLPKNIKKNIVESIEETIKVPVYHTSIYHTQLIGIFCVGVDNILLVPELIEDHEFEELKKLKIHVIKLKTHFTALGNNIHINGENCIVNPDLELEAKNQLKKLGFKVSEMEIAETKTIGACMVSNNRGCLVHRDAEDIKKIERRIKLPVNIGTVNLGNPYVKTGMIINSNGYIIGSETTGPELQRIDETLGFL